MIGICIFFLGAVRICLYRYSMRLCIGVYKGARGTTAAAFFVLWILEGLLRGSSGGQEAMVRDLFFFFAEIPGLFLLSFCYKGKVAGRLGMAFFLPTFYWAGIWSFLHICFGTTVPSDRQYFFATAFGVLLLWLFAGLFGKVRTSRQERERERLEMEVRMYERQFDLIQQSREATHALKHDMKHHIKMISDLVAGGQKEEVLAYLSSMRAFMEPEEEYVSSGNERIDSILNDMISRAKSGGTAVEWTVRIPEQLAVSTFDVNVILSNLLENALKALSRAEEPALSIRLQYDRKVLCIQIKNKVSEETYSLKEREGHGIGLKNVQKIVDKYHGSLVITREAGWFEACVLLFLP
ncbi:MAG: sensor histidine kinase [Lachnospiraceae bacterium]|nr:sensor histidine kinase [Lachnospiraceae bacterium]